MRFAFLFCLFFPVSGLVAQEAPLEILYPEVEVMEYVESGASGQYYLRVPGKPSKLMVFLYRKQGDLAFEVWKGKKKVWAEGVLVPVGHDRWKPEITRLAPGLDRALFFIMDRATMVKAQPSVSPLKDREKETACRRACTDTFLKTLEAAALQLGLYPPGKAVRKVGFGSVAFESYQEIVLKAWESYQDCQEVCE